MWVGIVGSRRFGECSCRPMRFPPPPAELEHAKVCPRVRAWVLIMKVVFRATQQPDFEGIVSGGAPGADSVVKMVCDHFGIHCSEFLPQPGPSPFWERAKRRNSRVVAKVGMLIALFAPGPRSPGTTDTVEKAVDKGIPVHAYHDGKWLTH